MSQRRKADGWAGFVSRVMLVSKQFITIRVGSKSLKQIHDAINCISPRLEISPCVCIEILMPPSNKSLSNVNGSGRWFASITVEENDLVVQNQKNELSYN